ncbi:MAG: metallophosphoesterase [Verrucomicrobiales bacterium]|nr:metallophosphoesterase [Verrucomicrobiales bacterium]
MNTRRNFLITAAGASAGTVLSPLSSRAAQKANSQKALFSVGLIADAQYTDAKPGGIRYYRKSIDKLGAAVKDINQAQVDFSIHLGDIIDRKFSSFDDILEPLNELKKPVHQILGNHDFAVAEDKKTEILAKMGIKETYHAFSQSGFRFIFLDGTDLSTFAQPKGSDLHAEATAMLTEFKAKKRKNAQDWNSAVGPKQFAWLKKQLTATAAAGEKAIVSCHYPILPDNVHNLWNDQEMLSLMDQHADTVIAWFNGHNHAGNYAQHQGVHYVTIQGMVDTPDSNAYAVLDVLPNALRIRGSGRVPSRLLTF